MVEGVVRGQEGGRKRRDWRRGKRTREEGE